MDEVSKTAHSVKTRLELLQQGNQAALDRKAGSTPSHHMKLNVLCTCQVTLISAPSAQEPCLEHWLTTAFPQLLSNLPDNH